jgi:hypothetical protein
MKVFIYTVVCLILFCIPTVFGYNADVGEAATKYAKPLETVLVDGPFYVEGQTYYTVDYMYVREVTGSLAYGSEDGKFITDTELIKKVFATRDLTLLTLFDPLFYAPGDPSNIPIGAKYETQNVRNFADFVRMSLQDRTQLELFLQTYERTAEDIARVNKITNSILYPGGPLAFSFGTSPGILGVKTDVERNFSYESYLDLLSAYDTVATDYDKLVSVLKVLAQNFEEYPVETPVREKWGVIITTENVKDQISFTEKNSAALRQDIEIRQGIFETSYEREIESVERLSGGVGKTFQILIPVLLFVVGLYFFFRYKRPPKLLLVLLLLLPVSQAVNGNIKIQTPEELLSQKVKNPELAEMKLFAKDLDEEKAKRILFGYPLLLEGEGVEVRGPFYNQNTSYYLYEIVKDGLPTGNGFLVNAESERLEPDQQLVFQAIKTRFVSELIADEPLYMVDPDKIESRAVNATIPVDQFLTNLSTSIREGLEVERNIAERPDFKDLREISRLYTNTFVLLRSIGLILPEEQAMMLTDGLFSKTHVFEAYARVVRGLSAEEYLAGRSAMYRARTLNRLPVIFSVTSFGFGPTMPQLIQDLTSDLIYDNYFLWRLGRVSEPNLFIRLPFKVGTETYPTQVDPELEG